MLDADLGKHLAMAICLAAAGIALDLSLKRVFRELKEWLEDSPLISYEERKRLRPR